MTTINNTKVDLEFIPFEILRKMSLEEQVSFIIKKNKDNKILIFDSQLTPQEEAKLISETMKHIDKKFSGIEICSLYMDKTQNWVDKTKNFIFRTLTGKMRGTSIIGPAKIIKQIKRDPESISILMK
ncbi:MAG: DUF2073 domain-containing protein [Candidatus Nanoarchaeia archaeon]|nr:DUF2073 domain-containing protein [Candidatus Nanoarchaeia archaeon]